MSKLLKEVVEEVVKEEIAKLIKENATMESLPMGPNLLHAPLCEKPENYPNACLTGYQERWITASFRT